MCFFQTILVGDKVKIAHASLQNIRTAANALVLRCAASSESQGGVASNIGTSSNAEFSTERDHGLIVGYETLQAVIITFTLSCLHMIRQIYSVAAPLVQNGALAKISLRVCQLSSNIFRSGRSQIPMRCSHCLVLLILVRFDGTTGNAFGLTA